MIIFLSILILLYGCNAKVENKEAEKISKEKFTSNVQITVDERTYKGTVNYLKDGFLKLEFIEPEDINGLVLTITIDGCNISFKELSYDIKPDQISQYSSASSLKNILDHLHDIDNISVSEDPEGKIYTGIFDGEKFEIKVGKNSFYKYIIFPEKDINITFLDYTA